MSPNGLYDLDAPGHPLRAKDCPALITKRIG